MLVAPLINDALDAVKASTGDFIADFELQVASSGRWSSMHCTLFQDEIDFWITAYPEEQAITALARIRLDLNRGRIHIDQRTSKATLRVRSNPPITVTQAIIGEPLSVLVDHGLTSRDGYVITSVERIAAETSLLVSFGSPAEPLRF